MAPDSVTTRFFEFAHEALAVHDEADYNFLHYLDMFSPVSTESFYVIDLRRRQFCYVSPRASFLCGYDAEVALELGYEFYSQIIHPKDLPLVANMHKAALRYLSNIGVAEWIDYFSCTFRLQQNYSFLSSPLPRMVYHKMKPVWIDDELRYFICSVAS